ncbi:MAG: NTP transferase domain-containing protein [Comamonadaceae bacterium]|nr:NTP transferase domain-containing protein [Comamonadaceae bacterium]
MRLEVIILAAGKGTRMRSPLPKVLHPPGRQAAARARDRHRAGARRRAAVHVVYGHGGERVRRRLAGRGDVAWVQQEPQLGTGHAVQQAAAAADDGGLVLVLYGDVPLTRARDAARA